MERDDYKKIIFSIVGVMLLMGVIGGSYAFFNYTRTGLANTIRVGQIQFNTVQGPAINLTNVFPIDRDDIDTKTDYVGSVTINVTGDTTYENGIEYLISASDMENTVGKSFRSRKLPISIDVDYSVNGNGNSIGTENNNYFNEGVRGGDTSYYKLLANNTMKDNDELLVGYIAPGDDGIDGNITIKAFLDKDLIGISDTFPPRKAYIVVSNMSQESLNTCVSFFTNLGVGETLDDNYTVQDFCQGTGTMRGGTFQDVLDFSELSPEMYNYLSANNIIKNEYDNGTTIEWADDREILTTNEWNTLQENGLSFKIKVEANEGIWVEQPGKISTCPGCKFMYPPDSDTYIYMVSNTDNKTPTVITSGLSDSYLDIVRNHKTQYFFGLILNENNQVTKGYICALKEGIPFCLEGSSDGSKYNDNIAIVQSEELWNNTCVTYTEYAGTESEFEEANCSLSIAENIYPYIHDHGCVLIGHYYFGKYKTCGVYKSGFLGCFDD